MALNSASKGCPMTSAFGKYIKEHYFPLLDISRITLNIGLLSDLTDDNLDFEEHFKENASVAEDLRETLLSKHEFLKDAETHIDSINAHIGQKQKLSEEELDFISKYVTALSTLHEETNSKAIIRKKAANAGILYRSITSQYRTFKNAIPAKYRLQTQLTVMDYISTVIDVVMEEESCSREEAVEEHFEDIVNRAHNLLIEDMEAVEDPTEEQKQIFESMKDTSKNGLWEACVFLTSNSLFNSESIKLGLNLEYLEELEDEDKNVADFSGEEVQSAENQGPEHWMLKIDCISGFFSMSKEAKSVLYHLYDDSTTIFGTPSVVDIMKTYKTIMSIRCGKAIQNSDDFLTAIRNSNQPWSEDLYTILTAEGNNRLRTIFFNSFRKNTLDYVYITPKTYSKNGSKGTYFFRNSLKPSGNRLLGEYSATLYDIEDPNICIFSNTGIVDKNKAKVLHNAVQDRIKWNGDSYILYNEDGSALASEEEKLDFIRNCSLKLNMHLSNSEIQDICHDAYRFKEFCVSLHQIFNSSTGVFEISNPNVNRNMQTVLGDRTASKKLKRLLVATRNPEDYSERLTTTENSLRYNGGTYFAMTIPNSLGDMFERFKNAYNQGGAGSLKSYIEKEYLWSSLYGTKESNGTYTISNDWLRSLYEAAGGNGNSVDEKFIKSFLENNVTRGLGFKDKAFEDFSERDNHLFNINEFFTASIKSEGKMGTIPLFVTGDSNATRYLPTKIYSPEDVKRKLIETAVQEVKRMAAVKSFVEYLKANNIKISNGHAGLTVDEWMAIEESKRPGLLQNLNKFSLLTELNEDAKQLEDLLKSYNVTDLTAFESKVGDLIDEIMAKGFSKFLETLNDKNILSNLEMVGAYYGKGTISPYTLKVEGMSTAIGTEELKSYYYNYKYSMMQQLQLFTVDPSFYTDTQELQKRYKEMIAAGEDLDLTALDEKGNKVDDKQGNQEVAYFDEIKLDLLAEGKEYADTNYMQALKDHGMSKKAEKYRSNTLTDGQGYRTFKSYRKICIMRGVWTSKMEEVYNLVQDIKAINNTETNEKERKKKIEEKLREIEKLNVIFQPFKPFYYAFEKVSDINSKVDMLVPVQHKYSEFPLIPELLPKGCKLAQFALALEEMDIDLACCTTCVKVGGFGSVNIHSDAEGNEITTKEGFKNALNGAYRHRLPLHGWRQQSNVPEHVNTSRAVGTQLIKHGFMCLSDSNEDKNYPFLKAYEQREFGRTTLQLTKSVKITLTEGGVSRFGVPKIVQLYNTLVSSGFIRSSVNLTKKITNPAEFSKILAESKMMDSRGAKDNVEAYTLDDKGEFLLSPAEGINAADNIASLLSLLRKDVIKRPIKGGSFVQVSGFGFENDLKVKTKQGKNGLNITSAECVVPFALSITGEDGQQIPLDYFEYVDPETGMLLGLDGKAEEPKDSDSEHPYYGWNTKLGAKFPGILDLIAYRIPTEKAYSVLNLKIKRFLPKTAGGVIIVPSQFTTIAGFDFDIDKLYFIRREFKYRRLSDLQKQRRNARIWNAIYDKPSGKKQGRSDIYKALVAARERTLQRHKDNLPEGGAVVASSTLEIDNSMGGAFPELTRVRSEMSDNIEDEVLNTLETEEVELTNEEQEEVDELTSENLENKRLFEYWEEAGLTEKTGKTASQYFTDFLLSHSAQFNNIVTYDKNKSVTEQPQHIINNMLFDLYQARLEDEDTFNERYTPGGFQQFEDDEYAMLFIRYATPEEWKQIEKEIEAAKNQGEVLSYLDAFKKVATLYKGRNPKYNATEPETLAHYQTNNAMYDKLIGIAANQNINMRLTALLGKLKLRNPVLFATMLDRVAKDSNVGCDVATRHVGGIDTELLATEPLTASVDAVKKALLEYYGIDENNFNIACLLTKIGATPLDIGFLLNQPVVQKALTIIKEGKGSKNLTYALDEAFRSLCGNSTEVYENVVKNINFNTDEGREQRKLYLDSENLIKGANPATKTSSGAAFTDFLTQQYAVLHLIQELETSASELSDEVNVSKATSTNSVKSTYGSIESLVQRAKAFLLSFGQPGSAFEVAFPDKRNGETSGMLINPTLTFNEDNIDEKLSDLLTSPFCIEQVAYSCILNFIRDIGQYFPYNSQSFTAIKEQIASMTSKGYLSEDVFNTLNKDIMCFFLERMVPKFNGDSPAYTIDLTNPNKKKSTEIPNRVFYNVCFADYFSAIMDSNKKAVAEGKDVIDYHKIPLLDAISKDTLKSPDGKTKRNILLLRDGGSLVDYQKDDFISSWEDMFASEDPILKDLAVHLFMYSYFMNGFDFSISSFMHLAPTFLKASLGNNDISLDTTTLDTPNTVGSYRTFFNRLFNLYYNIKTGELSEYVEGGLKPTGSNINISDFIKAFILNHYEDFPQFAKTVIRNTKEDSLYAALHNLMGNDAAKFSGEDDENTVDRRLPASFELDTSTENFAVSPLRNLVHKVYDDKGDLIYARFSPCVVIDGAVYICDSNSQYADNITSSGSSKEFNVLYAVGDKIPPMTYYRMNLPISNCDYSTPSLYTPALEISDKGEQELRNLMQTARDAFKDTKEPIPAPPIEDRGGSSADENEGKESIMPSLANNITDAFKQLYFIKYYLTKEQNKIYEKVVLTSALYLNGYYKDRLSFEDSPSEPSLKEYIEALNHLQNIDFSKELATGNVSLKDIQKIQEVVSPYINNVEKLLKIQAFSLYKKGTYTSEVVKKDFINSFEGFYQAILNLREEFYEYGDTASRRYKDSINYIKRLLNQVSKIIKDIDIDLGFIPEGTPVSQTFIDKYKVFGDIPIEDFKAFIRNLDYVQDYPNFRIESFAGTFEKAIMSIKSAIQAAELGRPSTVSTEEITTMEKMIAEYENSSEAKEDNLCG